jgi:proline iminopeptidase
MNETAMTGRTLAVGVPGGELIGVRSGSGRALLVLHGGPAVNDYSDWFVAELAGWDALRYTQRGVAPSVTEGPFTIEQHVSDALAVLDQHDVAAATVLGHSWGGYLAMQLAARAPGRVNALVLAETLGAVGDGGLAGFGAELEARATPEARARIAELDKLSNTSKEQEAATALEYFRLDWPGYFAVPAQAPPVPDTVRLSPEGHEQTSASLAEAAARGELPGLLSGFTGPVEVIAGERSPLPRQAAESTAAVFPDARLTIVPGAGHQLWHEAPGCLAAALTRVAARLT